MNPRVDVAAVASPPAAVTCLVGGRPHEPVAGVLSREQFELTLLGTLAPVQAAGRRRALIMIKVNGVARISRTLGFAAAGDLMEELGAELVEVGGPALVGRFAEDRFVAFRDDLADRAEAIALARQLVRTMGAPRVVAGLHVSPSISVGLVLPAGFATDPDAVLRDADAALQNAVRQGPNQVEVFSPETRRRLVRELEFEDELCLALARDELEVHFQPIVERDGGAVIALEALTRWQHPERGFVPPDQFLPIAEQSGLIHDLGDWILTEVCNRIATWERQDPLIVCPPISINVSMSQLSDESIGRRVGRALAGAGVSASSLLVELTESTAMELRPGPLEVLGELKRLGVRVMLDDFGTGYSSLSWLSRLPIDAVKVDRGFLSHVASPGDPVPILSAVTQIGKELGLEVVAEGVETADQLAVARAVGVDAVQGYLVARPQAVETAAELVALIDAARSVIPRPLGGRDPESEDLISIGTVAETLGISVSTARRLADSGDLPSVRTIGGHRRFDRRAIERFSRQRLGTPSLTPRRLPGKPLPVAGRLVREDGADLVERTRDAMYARPGGGWFAMAHGRARSITWAEALGETLARGSFHEGIDLTTSFLETATAAGASAAECVRFVSQFGQIAAARSLQSAGATPGEARDVQRFVNAVVEAFLEAR